MFKTRKSFILFGMSSLVLIIAGCAQNDSIFRTTSLIDGKSLVTDAKQRVVINSFASTRLDGNQPKRIVCAEPSPDVAQAISTAASLGAEASKGATDASIAAGFSSAQGVAQLGERLATIQVIREGLYRACEAYANGAISKTMYALIISRSDRAAVALLSSEMAAGAFGRKLAVIGSGADSIAGQSGASEEDIEGARGEVSLASIDLADARSALRKAENAVNAQSPSGDGSEARPELIQERNDRRAEFEEKREKVAIARRNLQDLRSASAASSATAVATAGGALSGAADGSAASVVKIHKTYSETSPIGPLIVACVHSLSSTKINYRGPATHKDNDGAATKFTKVCEGLFAPGKKGHASQIASMLKSRQAYQQRMARIENSDRFLALQGEVARACGGSAANSRVCNTMARSILTDRTLRAQ